MEVAINTVHEHNGHKVNQVKLHGTRTIAYVVSSPDGDAKTFHESDTLGASAYNDAMSLFIGKSGWTNHGKTKRVK